MLVQREIDWRDAKPLTKVLKHAKLKIGSACIEDILWRDSRNLDRHLITALAGGDWVRHARTVLLTGATGTGKTWLACALARQAARCGFTVLYARTTRLMTEPRVAHGEGSFARRLAQLARIDVLVLDDFAGAPMEPAERTDLLELLDDRVGTKATLITSQMAVNKWHSWLDDPTVADAILDRIVHGSHRIALKGPSLRKGEDQEP
jgi:DNA replication protein DnaC